MNLTEKVKSEFNQYLSRLNGERNSAFVQLQEKAFASFEQQGFPSTKQEEWKYTNLKSIVNGDFETIKAPSQKTSDFLDRSILKPVVANRLVFVNGFYNAALSCIIETDATIIISTLKAAQKENSVVFEKHFGKYAKTEGEALNALNTALLSDGAFIHLPVGKTASYPVIIYNISDTTESNVLHQPRNLVVIEKSAAVTLIESYYSIGNNSSFTNVVTEVYAAENAHLEHYKLQRQSGESYHNNYTQIFQEANTSINHVTLTLDGKLVRNNLHFYMNGENCNSLLYGLYVTENDNLVDNHTRVDHAKPNCFSDEKYKGILKDKSTAVFNGKIMVHLDAQKTNAYQRNQNILLSDEATVNTKPQLEIFADDVKCTHGATIGQLDEEPLFYLRSRGIPEDTARKMLLNAFADDIAERIKIPEVVQLLEREIERKL
jgi:Fe-S cluster assembly protein SufD